MSDQTKLRLTIIAIFVQYNCFVIWKITIANEFAVKERHYKSDIQNSHGF